MDYDEEDLPPQLVDVEEGEEVPVEEPVSIKVPITIVTGKQLVQLGK